MPSKSPSPPGKKRHGYEDPRRWKDGSLELKPHGDLSDTRCKPGRNHPAPPGHSASHPAKADGAHPEIAPSSMESAQSAPIPFIQMPPIARQPQSKGIVARRYRSNPLPALNVDHHHPPGRARRSSFHPLRSPRRSKAARNSLCPRQPVQRNLRPDRAERILRPASPCPRHDPVRYAGTPGIPSPQPRLTNYSASRSAQSLVA